MSVSFYFGLQSMNCVSFLNLRLFRKSHVPLIVIYEMLRIADHDCFHQRVVFLMSFVFPFIWLINLDFDVFFYFTMSHKSVVLWISNESVSSPSPSTCRVFDFICGFLYVGLPFWIRMYVLKLRFSQISFCPLTVSTNSYEHEISYSTFNVSCFCYHRRFPLRWRKDLDLYVFFEPTVFLKSNGWYRFCCEICDGFPSNLSVQDMGIILLWMHF